MGHIKFKLKPKQGNKPTHKGAYFVYEVILKPYGIIYDKKIDIWGHRLGKALLRQYPKGELEYKFADTKERLEWMKRQKTETPSAYKVYQSIMSSQESKVRYFWSKLLKN